MQLYECDYCGGIGEKSTVGLRGVELPSGILLPSSLKELDFCSQECFWAWIDKRLGGKRYETSQNR